MKSLFEAYVIEWLSITSILQWTTSNPQSMQLLNLFTAFHATICKIRQRLDLQCAEERSRYNKMHPKWYIFHCRQSTRRQRHPTQCSQMQHHRSRLQDEVSTTDDYIIHSSTPRNYLARTIWTTVIPRSPRNATHRLRPTWRNRSDSRRIS
jgi:uncharacterized protein YchJ